MKRTRSLSVEAALRQAVALWRDERPGEGANISAICKMAGVNRSNVYEKHADLLTELDLTPAKRSKAVGLKKETRGRTELELRHKIEKLEVENNLLRFLWLEEAGSPLKTRHPSAVMEDVRDAAALKIAAGRFFRQAVMSHLGGGTVDLSKFDSLDDNRKRLLIEYLSLGARPSPPSLEDYEALRAKLEG